MEKNSGKKIFQLTLPLLMLTSLTLVIFAATFPFPVVANSSDTAFFKDIKGIVADVRIEKSGGGLINGLMGENVSFPSKQDISADILAELKGNLAKQDKISIEQIDWSYLTQNDYSKLFILCRISLWSKNDLTPKLNHDVAHISLSARRNFEYDRRDKRDDYEFMSTIISLPDDSNLRRDAIKSTLSVFLKHYLIPKINCGNDNSCDAAK